MKTFFESMNIAFSMYSRIPMPRVDWNERNMKFTLCFFPFVGLVIGLLQGLLLWNFRGYPMFSAALAVLLPVLLTGGIHMDGFCDTMDALGSHQSREKKLEILKDSNSGAFAVMGCVLYLLLSFALWNEALEILLQNNRKLWTLMLGYGLSRSFSGLSVVTFPCAKNSGLAAMFAQSAEKRKARIILCLWLLTLSLLMMYISLPAALLCITAAAATFLYYRWLSLKEFGGITGDLAGYFLQLCELFMLATVLIGG